jgi:Tol biopolymer transport system component
MNTKKVTLILPAMLLITTVVLAQELVIAPAENLIADGVPKIPESLAETAGRYASYRTASLADWHPTKHEMLIATRFAETPQLHLVKMPGGERQQLTFFADAVGNGRFHPNGGDYIVFSKDVGGGEWYQLYRYDVATGDVTLLTDGKSRNLPGPWSSSGDQIAYMSTRRTGSDTDLWVMNPADSKTDHLLTQLAGGGWQPLDWSPDDRKILLEEDLSINESYLWLVDAATGEKTEVTSRNTAEKVSYGEGRFSKDGKGIYVTTDKDSEFHRLVFLDLATKQPEYLTMKIPWDVESFDLTQDGRRIAFLTNEEGVSVLHVMDTATKKETPLPKLPRGVVGAPRWNKSGRELGFSMNNARGPGDVYSLDVPMGKVERWTTSERDGGEDGCISTGGAGAMEKFRRKNDFRIFVQTTGEVYRQAAGAGGNSRRTRGAVAANISRTQQLSAERIGYCVDLSERSRFYWVREDIFADG